MAIGNDFAELRLRAERKLGGMLKDMEALGLIEPPDPFDDEEEEG